MVKKFGKGFVISSKEIEKHNYNLSPTYWKKVYEKQQKKKKKKK